MPHHCTPGSGRDSRWGSHWLAAQGGEIERVEDEQAPGSSPDKRKPKRKVAPEAAAPESSAGDFQEPPVIKRKVGSPASRPAGLPASPPVLAHLQRSRTGDLQPGSRDTEVDAEPVAGQGAGAGGGR